MFFHHSGKAIVHIDGDAFFASCEQAINPQYRGKPVVTGAERNIVSAASYEAKKLGIKRGIPLWKVKDICKDVIILPSHYETYGLFSQRMYDIIRRYTTQVEEYSIDEAFADITGLRRPLHKTYFEIAKAMKEDIERELGITVSVGLSYTKVLAKIASKYRKPSGLVHIHSGNIESILKNTEVIKIWGIGHQTSAMLYKHNIKTADDLSKKDEFWVDNCLSKPYKEVWWELNGKSVYPVVNGEKDNYKSIGKTKTFAPPSTDVNYIFSQLSKNVENAFIKARRYNLAANKIMLYLKTNNFRYSGLEVKLSRASSFPNEVMPLVKEVFAKLFLPQELYRATGVVLFGLQSRASLQLNLFESPLTIEKLERVYEAVDALDEKYGKHTIFLGSSLLLLQNQQHKQKHLINVRQSRQFIHLPFLGNAN